MRAVSARPNPAVVRVWQDGSPAPRAAERGAVGAELGRVAASGALAPELLVPAQLLRGAAPRSVSTGTSQEAKLWQ